MSDEKIKELEDKVEALTAGFNKLYEIVASSFAALASIGVNGAMISPIANGSSTTVPETTEEG